MRKLGRARRLQPVFHSRCSVSSVAQTGQPMSCFSLTRAVRRPAQRPRHEILGDAAWPELGPAEHSEAVVGIDHTPCEVDEPLSGTSLDLWATEVGRRTLAHHLALEVPHRMLGVATDQTKEVLLALAPLHGHVNVVMAVGEVRPGTTPAPRRVVSLDADPHPAMVANLVALTPSPALLR
jgi:hypothetical protein